MNKTQYAMTMMTDNTDDVLNISLRINNYY